MMLDFFEGIRTLQEGQVLCRKSIVCGITTLEGVVRWERGSKPVFHYPIVQADEKEYYIIDIPVKTPTLREFLQDWVDDTFVHVSTSQFGNKLYAIKGKDNLLDNLYDKLKTTKVSFAEELEMQESIRDRVNDLIPPQYR